MDGGNRREQQREVAANDEEVTDIDLLPPRAAPPPPLNGQSSIYTLYILISTQKTIVDRANPRYMTM